MHAEVTSPDTVTIREEERKLCQPQKLSLIYSSSKEMDESVLLSLKMQLRNMHNKTIIGFGFCMIAIIIKASVCVIRLSLRPRQKKTNFGLDNYRYPGKTESNNC